jgi:hypothetical protein
MNIRPVGAELIYADVRTGGRTDRQDEANSRFSQFCERALKPVEIIGGGVIRGTVSEFAWSD